MIRIIVRNPEQPIPDIYKDADGQVSIDIYERTRIVLTKVIDDFIEAGSIKQDNFKEIEIPISKKNRLIFGNVGNPNALNQNHSKIFDIQLLKDDDYSYPVQGLQVFDTSDQNKSYVCTIFGELNDWYRPLKNLKLNELELGNEVVDFNFYTTVNNDVQYIDGGYPIRTPLANYGRWYVNNNKSGSSEAQAQVVFNNFRMWFAAKALLDQMFCQVGYELVAPFMQTDTFRQLMVYILDPNFETANQLDVANRPFEATRPTDLVFLSIFSQSASGKHTIGVVNMGFTPVIDPGSHYFTRPAGGTFPDEDFYGSFYSAGMIGNFVFNGSVRFQPTNAPSLIVPVAGDFITLNISIRKANKFGIESQQELIDVSTVLAERTYIDKNPFVNGTLRNYDFQLDTGSIKVYQHEVLFIFVQLEAELVDTSGVFYDETFLYNDMYLELGSTFKNVVQQQVIEEGDTIEFGKLLRADATCAELFKGLVHLYNFKIETDSISKKVFLYPEFKTDLNSDGIQEGFFMPNQVDVFDATDKIQAGSMIEKTKPNDLGRDVYLKFLNSTDGYIAGLGLTDELHSKRIDLGSEFMDSVNEIENPFFEPTANAIDAQIGTLPILTGPYTGEPSANYIPLLWESATSDGTYPDVGFDYGPRIGIFVGNTATFVEPSVSGFDNDTQCYYIYEDLGLVSFPALSQIWPTGVGRDLAGTKIPIDKAIVYGNGINTSVQDLYELIYERSINQAYFTPSLEFLVKLSLLDFSNLSFRRKWRLKYDSCAWGEIEIYARIARINDFLISECLTTPILLIPDNNNFNRC